MDGLVMLPIIAGSHMCAAEPTSSNDDDSYRKSAIVKRVQHNSWPYHAGFACDAI